MLFVCDLYKLFILRILILCPLVKCLTSYLPFNFVYRMLLLINVSSSLAFLFLFVYLSLLPCRDGLSIHFDFLLIFMVLLLIFNSS